MSPPVMEALLDEKETYFIARVLLVVAASACDRSTWRTSFRKSIVQPRAGFMSHSTRSGSVPVALFENHDFHLTG